MALKSVAKVAFARGPAVEAARVGPEEHAMSRSGNTTISLQTQLYLRIALQHVPKRARSVQAYVTFWVTAGDLIDRALDSTNDPQELIAALQKIVARDT